ncbi:hypothetical protein M6D93_13780 [Jatrophihabitans telluris]|uniref:Uncharacterized protein n=1 Tax=Jatrophihabitans telluris TaxID=2038343 RepID=A0ABY4QUQ9_9ACTN|nr:hypothetical protein [Jatrophihabitans telluris]UQX87364.1 hypothetical protein M6D93_13780 [Jatrophihabitans telluris]
MISRFEARKDLAQVLTESAAEHIGRIAVIITGAVRDVAREVGDWASDAFEMGEAAKRATAADPATDAAADPATDPAPIRSVDRSEFPADLPGLVAKSLQ